MVKTVQSSNWVLMVDWMRSSVSRSIAAVASSRMRILVFLKRARAKHTSCLWPTLETPKSSKWNSIYRQALLTVLLCLWTYLRFSPPSEHSRSSFAAWLLTNLWRWECSRAFHTSSSLYFSKGSRFILSVPENSTGSWGKHRNTGEQDKLPQPWLERKTDRWTFSWALTLILQSGRVLQSATGCYIWCYRVAGWTWVGAGWWWVSLVRCKALALVYSTQTDQQLN